MKKVALLIDGGHLRVQAKKDGHRYNPDFIEKVAHACVIEAEELFRIFYYDCPPFSGTKPGEISGKDIVFSRADEWLHELATRDLFAVRLGVLKFRGWKLKKKRKGTLLVAPSLSTNPPPQGKVLSDDDFRPDFEQKGVDMRIGIDIASMADRRVVERIILITADTDCIPAMKYGRIGGLQVVAITLPNAGLTREFLAHVDIKRAIAWPK